MEFPSQEPKSKDVSVLESLHCPICLEFFTDAVESKCCHNIFCETCYTIQTSCPLCRSLSISYHISLPIRRIVSNLPMCCPDCYYLTTRGELPHHNCPYKLYTCALCHTELTKENMKPHMFDMHLTRY